MVIKIPQQIVKTFPKLLKLSCKMLHVCKKASYIFEICVARLAQPPLRFVVCATFIGSQNLGKSICIFLWRVVIKGLLKAKVFLLFLTPGTPGSDGSVDTP